MPLGDLLAVDVGRARTEEWLANSLTRRRSRVWWSSAVTRLLSEMRFPEADDRGSGSPRDFPETGHASGKGPCLSVPATRSGIRVWYAQQDSNLRPWGPQPGCLTR